MPVAKRTPKPKPPPDPHKLAREQAGSYRSGDGRFVVHQDHGGKWYVTDVEQTNELGLELVLGPFATIAEAKAAMEMQREQPAGVSPGAKIRSLVTGDRERAKSAGQAKPQPEPTPKPGSTPTPSSAQTPRPTPTPTPTPEPTPTPRPKITAEPKPTPTHNARPEPFSGPEPSPRPAAKATARPKPTPIPKPEPPKLDYRPAPWRHTGDERDAVASVLRRISDAWTSSNPADLRDFLDPEVVFVQPGFAARTEGRDGAIESYRAFMASAKLRLYAESDLTIDLRGHSAVVTYRFEIDYEMHGKRVVETGRDLFVLDRAGTRWRVTWRLLISDPAPSGG